MFNEPYSKLNLIMNIMIKEFGIERKDMVARFDKGSRGNQDKCESTGSFGNAQNNNFEYNFAIAKSRIRI